MSEADKWRMFIGKGRKNPAYLRPGDRISASIRTDDGAIDLGEQTTVITGMKGGVCRTSASDAYEPAGAACGHR